MPACMGPPPAPAEGPPQPGQAPTDEPQQAQAQPQDNGQQAGEDDANIEDFYEPLANYGTWVDTPEYGRVWQPADDVAGEDFVPYASDGAWAANDDGDWVFQSKYENEFGWATYHYGRWAEHDDYGWVWVPGTTWAPSWVEWRYGGGYVGWVPMGPPGVTFVEDRWFFVEERSFGAPVIYGYRVPPDRVHVAYMAASPIVEVRGRARWTAGPPVARLRASGVSFRAAHTRAPARGYVRTTARTVRAAGASRPRAAAPKVRHSASRPKHHDAPPPAHHDAPKHHDAPPAHHDAPKHQAPPPKKAPPPRPRRARSAERSSRRGPPPRLILPLLRASASPPSPKSSRPSWPRRRRARWIRRSNDRAADRNTNPQRPMCREERPAARGCVLSRHRSLQRPLVWPAFISRPDVLDVEGGGLLAPLLRRRPAHPRGCCSRARPGSAAGGAPVPDAPSAPETPADQPPPAPAPAFPQPAAGMPAPASYSAPAPGFVPSPGITFAPTSGDGRDVVTPAAPRQESDFHLDLGFGTELPISIGGVVTAEVPGRVLFQLGLGFMPHGYAYAIDGFLTSVGAYNQTISNVVRSALGNSFVLRASAGWRPSAGHGFEISAATR